MLIQGLQGVIRETVEESIKPVIKTMAGMEKRLVDKIDGVEKRLDQKIDSSIDITNQNDQAQLASLREELKRSNNGYK